MFSLAPARRRGAKPQIPLAEQLSLFKKKFDKFVINGYLAKSSSDVYKEVAKKYGLDPQCVYLNAKRYFAKQNIFAPCNSKEKEDDVFEKCDDQDLFFSISVKNVDVLQQFQHTSKYVKGIRSLLRELIWK